MSKQNGQGRIEQPNKRQGQEKDIKRNVSTKEADKLQEEADQQQRTKKPGSQKQSGGSGRHNNGRGGGK